MANVLYTNQASSLLAANINDIDTIVQVSVGEGALFPSPGASQFFALVLQDQTGSQEVTYCTSRTGDLLTVVRAQEGTAAQSWTNGITRCELRLTAGVMQELYQKNGDSLTGPMNANGQEIQNSRVTGSTVVVGGQLVGTAVRGTEDDTSNEVLVPNDGSRATAGGSPLVTQSDNIIGFLPVGAVIMWAGTLGSIPSGWQLCDGSNGTPDLRDRFPRGAGGLFTLGNTGGASTAAGNTGTAGSHSHTGSADGHVLTASEMPSHKHNVLSANGPGSVTVRPNLQDSGVYGIAGAGYSSGGPSTTYRDTSTGLGQNLLELTGGGAAHGHSLTLNSSGSHSHSLGSVSIIPPYLAIYFIMRVA